MIRAVLFDMDGLIVDTEPIHFKAFRAFVRDFGHEMPESLMAGFVGYPESENIRDLQRMFKIEGPLDEMVARRRVWYQRLAEEEPIVVFPGFWELSDEARRRGLKQAVVSSSTAPQVEVVLRRLFQEHPERGKPEEYFDAIVNGEEVPNNKPAPDIYAEAAARLGVRPEECVAFEDTPAGVRAATEAGAIAIAVPNDYSRGQEFPGARAVIASLREGIGCLDL